MKIAFLGGGNLANALVGGLVKKGFAPGDIAVMELDAGARERIAAHGVRIAQSPGDADVLVVAVKPQDMRKALASVAGFPKEKLVVSVAAGIRIDALSRWLGGHRKIVRVMPNTPSLIGAGIAGLYADPAVTKEERGKAESILRAVGEVVWLDDERLIDPVTAVAASGPAYVFWFIEQMAASAVKLGIGQEDALKFAKHMVLGAARLAAESERDPARLRKDVTSKGGTTEAALNVLAAEQVAERLHKAVEAASRRGAEMGDEMGKD